MSEDMPEDMPEYMPEDMPDRMPNRMAEDMSDRMPEDMPERMPDNMPEDMPDRMPDRMPEDLPDRMPEDLPARKCINVMVGITRSKVIVGKRPPPEFDISTVVRGHGSPKYLCYLRFVSNRAYLLQSLLYQKNAWCIYNT